MPCCDHSAGKIKPAVNEEETKELWCRMIDSRRVWNDFRIWITARIFGWKIAPFDNQRVDLLMTAAQVRWPALQSSPLCTSIQWLCGTFLTCWVVAQSEKKGRKGLWKHWAVLNPMKCSTMHRGEQRHRQRSQKFLSNNTCERVPNQPIKSETYMSASGWDMEKCFHCAY